MACEYCCKQLSRDSIRLMLGPNVPLRYCPACGEDVKISEFLDSMKEAADDALTKAFIELDKANETVEIDGETLIVERIPTIEKPISRPMDLGINLDNIDISREMAMLSESPLKKHEKYISERVKQMIKEKRTIC